MLVSSVYMELVSMRKVGMSCEYLMPNQMVQMIWLSEVQRT